MQISWLLLSIDTGVAIGNSLEFSIYSAVVLEDFHCFAAQQPKYRSRRELFRPANGWRALDTMDNCPELQLFNIYFKMCGAQCQAKNEQTCQIMI